MGALPAVFVDRSLGRVQIPSLLRDAGIGLVRLAEHYGLLADEQVADVTWIAESARRGWIAFMKDFAIKRRPADIQAILDNGARCFCLPDANLRAAAMARRYSDNLERIVRASARTGPFLYTVQVDRLVPVRLRP